MSIFDVGNGMQNLVLLVTRIATALEGINDSLAEILQRIDNQATPPCDESDLVCAVCGLPPADCESKLPACSR